MLDPPPPLVRHCPNLVTPLPLGYPACFKNVCNFRFIIVIISLILLKNTFGNFFILLLSMKQLLRQNISYNVSMIQNLFYYSAYP